MAKKTALASILAFLMWVVGVIVSLAVGFALTSDVLVIPYIPLVVTEVAGWVVVIVTIIGAIMAIVEKLS